MATVSVNPPKTPVTKGSSGIAAATVPNVCKMPGPPAPFVPTPLPNIGKSGDSPNGYSKKVKVEGQPVAIKGASFKSMGDIASKGTGGGIVSSNTHGPTKFIGPGSFDVKIEGKNVQFLGDPMLNNCGPSGSPANSATLQGEVQPPSMTVEGVEKAPKEESIERDRKNGYDHKSGKHDGKDVTSYQVFDTPPKKSELIYVIKKDGTAAFAPRPTNRSAAFARQRGRTLPHSMLAQGEPVLGAGECTTDDNGKVDSINNQSGHYQPGETQLKQTKKIMDQGGLTTEKTQWSKWDAKANANTPVKL